VSKNTKTPQFYTTRQVTALAEANEILHGGERGSKQTLIDVCNRAIEVLDWSIDFQKMVEERLGIETSCTANAEDLWTLRWLFPHYWLWKIRR